MSIKELLQAGDRCDFVD